MFHYPEKYQKQSIGVGNPQLKFELNSKNNEWKSTIKCQENN